VLSNFDSFSFLGTKNDPNELYKKQNHFSGIEKFDRKTDRQTT